MKKDSKTTPLIAAHSANKNNHKQTGAKIKSFTLDRITDGIVALDAEMKYTYVNECAGKLLGRKPNEFMGEQLVDLKSDQPPFAAACQQAFETQTIVPFHGYFAPTDAWLEGRVYPSEDGISVLFADSNERKQVDESLRALIDQTTAGITRVDMDGRITFINRTFCEMLGYSEAELIGKTIWEISAPDDLPKHQRLFERMRVEGEPYHLEKRLIRKNGSVLWVSVGTSPLRDANGRTYSAVSMLADITRRKRAEQSLLETARRTLYLSSLSDVIRPLSDPFQIQVEALHALGIHLKASRAAYAEIGAPGTLLIRHDYVNGVENNTGEFQISDFVPAEFLATLRLGSAVMVTDMPNDSRLSESQRLAYDSAAVRSQIIVPLVKDEQLIAVLIVQQSESRDWSNEEINLVEDTAERMQAAIERAITERKLSESENRFRILSNTVPSMVWVTAPDGTVLYLNDHWYHYTGLSPDESISNWAELSLHTDDYESYITSWKHALAAVPHEYVQEVRYRRYDGEYRWFQSRAVPALDENGHVTAWYGVSTDIHDRVEKQAELQQVINQTPFMLTRCSRDLRYRFVSRAYAKMIGRTPEEVEGKPIVEIMGQDGLKTIAPFVEQVLQGQRVEYETEVSFENVGTPALHVVYVPDYDERGEVIGWFASITDVTERNRTEQALARERELLERVFETMPVMLSMYDPATGLQRLNPQFKKLTGWGNDGEMTPQALVEVCYPDIAYRKEVLQRLASAAPNEWVDVQMQARNGHTLDTTWSNIRFSNGTQVGLGIDITERKRAEERLRASEESYRRIVETANEGVWEIDKDGRTVFVNARTAEMLGYSVDEMMGRSAFDFVFPEDHPDGEQRMARAKRGVPARSHEFRYRGKDGLALWTLVSTSPQMDEQGNFLGSIAMMMDITERKLAEQSLAEYARRQTALYTLTDKLHRANTMDDVFNASLDAILNALQCDRASILLFDETRIMHFVAWRGLSDDYRTATDGHSPWKYGEENPVPIFFNDIATADLSESLRTVIAGEGIGSLGFIPLVFRGRLIGKFMVYFNTPHTFGESEVGLAQTIARQLASGVERKRNEEALRQSEERFSRFMQYLPGLAWIKDHNGRYIYANTAAEKAFNAPQAQLYGRSDEEIFATDIASQFRLNDEQVLVEGRSIQVVETLPQPDGVLHHSLVTKFPIPGLDGDTALIGGTAFDITERVHMEDSLRKARKQAEETADRMSRLQEVTASLAGAVAPAQLAELVLEQGTRSTGAAAGILVEVINNGKELETVAALGYPPELVRTEPVSISASTPLSDCIRNRQAIWIESHDEFALQYPSLAESRRSIGNEAAVALPLLVGDRVLGGLAFSFREKREFLLEERGFLLAMAVQCAQGLERARTEAALHESEERYRAIVNQATAGIVRKDSLGQLLFVNDAFCRMLGYDKSELTTKTMWQLTHEQDVQENQRLFNRLMVEGASFQLEKRLIRRDGSILWVTVSVSPVLDAAGRTQSAVSVYADITERKHAEERLTLLADISELTRNLEEPSELMSAVAHVVGEHLRVKRCLFNEIDLEHDMEIVHRDYHDGIESVEGTHKITDYSNITTAEMVAGKTVVNHDSKLDPRTAQDYERSYVPNGERAYVAVPLMRDDRWVASLWVSTDTPRQWSTNEVSLLETIAERTWTATEKLRINAALRDSEERLRELNLELEGRVQRRTAELQSANEFLRESEATSRLILESVPDAIVITNPEGVVVHCNTQVQTLFGYSPNEVLGQSVEMLLPKRYHQQHLAHRKTFGESPTRRMMGAGRQLFGLRRSGEEFPVEVALSPISNNTTWDVIITIRDNSMQRQAQEALRVSEEKLRTLFEILPVGISFLNQKAQIIEMNSALTQILGLSKSELLRGAFKSRDYIRSDGSLMSPSEFASIRALKDQKTIYNVETGIVKENGETIWTSVNAAPVKVADVEAVVVTVDITERKNAENALHKNRERLRALSRRLVEVQEDERRAIARELHDRVGQNLAALNLNLNILRGQLSDEALVKIGSRLTDSVQLVNDIVTITRSVMADLRSNVLDDYGLESALREYADQFTQRFGVQVVADKTSRSIPRFDPSIEMTLLRIAQEALTNVARHSQASQATITLNMEGNAVKMTIQDNGIGILSWQKANQKGSHGLRIIRERTEAFGGSVQIQSAYKKGTTIEVKIPIENGNQARVSREKRS